MAEQTIDELEGRIGETIDSVTEFRIERGKVAEFARAIGDDNPAYRDETAARAQGFRTIPAPPTFTRVSMFPRYRPPGTHRLGLDVGFDIEREIHGEQVYEFERPVYVGDVLHGTTTLADASQRDGRRGGTMTFVTLVTEFRDASDALVVTERSTLIETESAIEDSRGRPEEATGPRVEGAEVRQPTPGYDQQPSVEELRARESSYELTVSDISRPDFVRYAGASGDFNPIHYDERYARSLGNPRVFGQGMLTAGYASHLASDWLGLAAIRRFETRFLARVWPGDTVTLDGVVREVDADTGTVTAEITATRQTGEDVLEGEVIADLSNVEKRTRE